MNVDYILSSAFLKAIENESEDGEKTYSDLSRNVTPAYTHIAKEIILALRVIIQH